MTVDDASIGSIDEPQKALTTFAFVLIPRFNMMALTAAIEPLRVANYLTATPLYAWEFLSPVGGNVVASNGMELATGTLPVVDRRYDIVFVCSSWDSEHYEDKNLFAWLRRQDRFGAHLGAMDLGTYVLARAGLLEGYRTTILWYCANAFAEAFPGTEAVEHLFVIDRNRTTIAGGTAGLDMMLDDIKRRHDVRLSHEVADHILHFPVRQGNSDQRHSAGGQQDIVHPLLRKAIHLMENHVEEPMTVPNIADDLGISQRKLERLFQKHVGRSAVGYYRILRLQYARVMLTNTELSVREISVACGYSSLSHFAKSFAEQFGRRPRDCRDAWPDSEPAPVWPGLSVSLNNVKPLVGNHNA